MSLCKCICTLACLSFFSLSLSLSLSLFYVSLCLLVLWCQLILSLCFTFPPLSWLLFSFSLLAFTFILLVSRPSCPLISPLDSTWWPLSWVHTSRSRMQRHLRSLFYVCHSSNGGCVSPCPSNRLECCSPFKFTPVNCPSPPPAAVHMSRVLFQLDYAIAMTLLSLSITCSLSSPLFSLFSSLFSLPSPAALPLLFCSLSCCTIQLFLLCPPPLSLFRFHSILFYSKR